jgi:hypothetical protein
LAVSFPTLRRSAWTIASRFGPATEPAIGVTTAGVSGETSQPGVHTHACVLQPNPARMHLRMVASAPLPQGRHRTIWSRSFALRHGSCLLTLKLRSSSHWGDPVFGASLSSDLIAVSTVITGLPAPSDRSAHSATIPSLIVSRLRHRNLLAACCSSETAGKRITTLVHSSNCRFLPTVFAHMAQNPGPWGVTRLRGWFARSAPLLVRITDRCRSPPGFLVIDAGRQNPP